MIAMLAAVAPAKGGAAVAKPCDTGILVLSGSSDTGSTLDTGSLLCVFGPTKNRADARIINPGSDVLIIRYGEPVRYSPSRLTATLNGIGFRNKTVYVYKSVIEDPAGGPGTPIYESGYVWLPQGSSSSGCLKLNLKYVRTISRKKVTVLNKSTQYFTVDAGC